MAGPSKLIEDLVRTASNAAGTVFGLRDEVEAQMRERFERVLSRADLVSRDEFEAVKAVASAARTEQEVLTGKVAELEARLAKLEKPAARKPRASSGTKPKAASQAGSRAGGSTKKAPAARRSRPEAGARQGG